MHSTAAHLLDVDRENGLLLLAPLTPAATTTRRAIHGAPGHVPPPSTSRGRAEAAAATALVCVQMKHTVRHGNNKNTGLIMIWYGIIVFGLCRDVMGPSYIS